MRQIHLRRSVIGWLVAVMTFILALPVVAAPLHRRE